MAENGYAKPVLVTTDWLAEHLNDDNVIVAEVDENPDLYDEGHIAGAVKLHWRDDLQDPVERDLVDKPTFERLMSERGISNDSTLVLYGDKNNWFAAYAYWYLKIYGHEDVRILDGGRQKWADEGREFTAETPQPPQVEYKASERDESIRTYRDSVKDGIGEQSKALVDVRSPQEYTGELIAPPGYEQEGAQRAGHIPTAASIPWATAVRDDGTFKSAPELRELYEGKGVALRRRRKSRRIAGSVSAVPTRGSSCASCSATRPSRTTTVRGRSGATSSTCRSKRVSRRWNELGGVFTAPPLP